MNKELKNIVKHNVNFSTAQQAFFDPMKIITENKTHSKTEGRFYCYGMAEGKVLTVRFTMRGNAVRIIGAGYWRKGKKIYEKENQI